MCLDGLPYKIYLNSNDGSLTNQTDGTTRTAVLHKKYEFNWSDFKKQIGDDIKYFHLKIESFSMFADGGLVLPSLEIHCPQMESPYYSSSNQQKPIGIAHSSDVFDANTSAGESIKAMCYKLDASQQEGQIVCIKNDSFIEIKLLHFGQDPNLPAGAINGRSVPTDIEYTDDSTGIDKVKFPQYTMILSLTPIKGNM